MLQSDAAKRLREARYAKGWSRKKLSEATEGKVHESTIVNVETWTPGDSYDPFPQTIWSLAAVLGLDFNELWTEEEVAS